MVGVGRCLQVSFFERLAVPDPVTFVDGHVVHVYGNPYIGGSVRDVVVHVWAYGEVVGLFVAVLDVIDSRFLHFGEVELDVIVFVIRPPYGSFPFEYFGFRPVCFHLPDGCLGDDFVVLVQFDDGLLGL